MDNTNPISSSLQCSSKEQELPLGWKFHPTPYELVKYYLVPKYKGEEISKEYVRDLDVYMYDPDQLPLNQSKYARANEAYFFVYSQRSTSQIRTTPNGYWKIYEENVPLHGPNGAIGFKNKLEYYIGKNPNGNKTDWKMVEYKADQTLIPTNTCNMDSYIVCKVKRKIEFEESLVEEESESSEEISGGDGGNAKA